MAASDRTATASPSVDAVHRYLALLTEVARGRHDGDELDVVLTEIEPSDLIELARGHGVEDLLLDALEVCRGVPPVVLGELEARHRARSVRQLAAQFDLRHVGDALGAAGISWLLIKGPVLSSRVYANPALRPYDDLDIVIPQQEFAAAVDALEAAGAVVLDRNWDLIVRQKRGQLHMALEAGTVADIHWHLVNQLSLRQSMSIPMQALLERSRVVRVDGLDVRTLDATDTLLHVCLHAGLSGGHRLRWLIDVDRLLSVDPPDWDLALARARRWGVGPCVGAVLWRASRIAQAPVPDEVAEAMIGSSVRRAVARLAERSRPELRPLDASLGTVLTQAARSGRLASARALVARLTRARVAALHGDAFGEGEPAPIVRDTGSRFSQSLFLSWVRETSEESGRGAGHLTLGDPLAPSTVVNARAHLPGRREIVGEGSIRATEGH